MLLPEDFTEQRHQAASQLESARTAESAAMRAIAELDAQLDALVVPEDLLAEAEAVERLRDALAGYQKARAALPDERGRLRLIEDDIASARFARSGQWSVVSGQWSEQAGEDRSSLTTDHCPLTTGASGASDPSIGPTRAQKTLISRLAGELARLIAEQDQAGARVAELAARLESEQAERDRLAAPGDSEPLSIALRQARDQGDLDSRVESARARLDQAGREASQALARLPMWSGPREAAAVSARPAPTAETVDRFEAELADVEAELARLRSARADAVEEADNAGSRLAALLESAGVLPTEDDLALARDRRDRAWRLIRRALETGESPVPRGGPGRPRERRARTGRTGPDQPGRPGAGLRAGGGAGRCLRRPAAAGGGAGRGPGRRPGGPGAARAGAWSTSTSRGARPRRGPTTPGPDGGPCGSRRGSCPSRPARCADGSRRGRASCRRPPRRRPSATISRPCGRGPPRIARRSAGAGRAGRGRGGSRAHRPPSRRIPPRCRAGPAPRPRRRGPRAADPGRRARDELLQSIEQLRRQLESARAQVQAAGDRLGAWREKWARAVAPLGLPPEASPEQADAVLEQAANLAVRIKEAREARARIESFEREAGQFAGEVRDLCRRVDAGTGHETAPAPGATDPLADPAGVAAAAQDLIRRLAAARRPATAATPCAADASRSGPPPARPAATARPPSIGWPTSSARRACSAPEDLPAAERGLAPPGSSANRIQELDQQLGRLCGHEDPEAFRRAGHGRRR